MAPVPRVGSELSGYRLEAVIGRGGMGVVYLAQDLRLGRKVALKVLDPELAENDRFRERFVSEPVRAASLSNPNIIPIFNAGEADGVLYIAMQYVKGSDLRGLLEHEGRLDPARTLSIVAQVASALDAAHAEGLVHRDVKPGNVMIASGAGPEATDHVYLTDFGLMKRANSDSGITRTGTFVGTVDYVAPEQIEGKPVDGRTDQYSLGVMAFECLTGSLPFPKDQELAVMWAHVHADPPRASERVSGLPPAVDQVLARAMAKSPSGRYPTCGAMVAGLREALGATATRGTGQASTGGDTVTDTPKGPEAPLQPPAGDKVTRAASQPNLREPEPLVPFSADRPPSAPHPGPSEEEAPPVVPPPPVARPKKGRARSRRPWALVAVVVGAIVIAGAVAAVLLTRSHPPPSAPTLGAVSTQGRVRLSWAPGGNASEVTGYRIFRDERPIATVGGATRVYVDNSVQVDTRYAYAVEALAGDRHSSLSRAVSVSTLPEPFPNAEEASILSHVSADYRSSCQRASPVPAGALAGIRCGSGTTTVVYDKFPSKSAVGAYYRGQLQTNGIPGETGHCPSRLPSDEYWFLTQSPNQRLGRLACYQTGDHSFVIWTDVRYLYFASASQPGLSEGPVYDFWNKYA